MTEKLSCEDGPGEDFYEIPTFVKAVLNRSEAEMAGYFDEYDEAIDTGDAAETAELPDGDVGI